MLDQDKFMGAKQQKMLENERRYGSELREKFGDEAIDRSNKKFMRMTAEQQQMIESLTDELNEMLKAAFEQGDPAGELAQKACALHKEWLSFYWDSYSEEAHKGVAQMYVDDPRFTVYYDSIAPGCAAFLRDAVVIFCEKG